MNCRETQDFIHLRLYGSLAEEHEQALRNHLEACPACCEAAKQMMSCRAIDVVEPPALPDWEASWRIISERCEPRYRQGFPVRPLRLALAGVAVLVFGLGIFVGRFFLSPYPERSVAAHPASWQSYAESLEPMLVDFMNPSRAEPSEEFLTRRRALLADLISRTRLLKRLLSLDDDDYLRQLFDDLEARTEKSCWGGKILSSLGDFRMQHRTAQSGVLEFVVQCGPGH